MQITVIATLVTALLLTRINGGERSSKQLFYTTYLYPSVKNSAGSHGSGGNSNNGYITPQISISPLHTFWSSYGDHDQHHQKGRQTATLIPVSAGNANHNQAFHHQLRQQQMLWSPSLPLGTSSFIAAPLQQSYHNQQVRTTGLTAGAPNHAPSKNVKQDANSQVILPPQQSQLGPAYQIHPSSSNSLQTPALIGYVNVPLNPSYNFWNGGINNAHSTATSYLQSGLGGNSLLNNWNLPLKSYEQIQNELATNSIVAPSPISTNQNQPPSVLKGFQRGHVEAPPVSSAHAKLAGTNNAGGFNRGNIESKPAFASEHSTLPKNAVVGQLVGTGTRSSTGFNRGAVEHRFPEELQATTYDAPTKNVICYFASWSFHRKRDGKFIPENADPSLCTHIVYAFAILDKSKYAIKESDPFTDNNKYFYQRTIALKQANPSLKVMLGIGGWSDSGDDKYSKLAHNQAARRKFARETAKFLRDRNFDGLSFDWHYPKCWQSYCEVGVASDKLAFAEFMRELKMVFAEENLILAATLSGYQEIIDVAYDIPSLSHSLDFLSIMSYDYHGSWETKTGHVAPLFNGPPASDPYPHYNANYTMEYYAAQGADRSKLMLGVPMYGQTFQLSNPGDSSYGSEANGPGQAGEFTSQPGMLAYYEICKRIKDQRWTVQKDITGSWGPYAYKGNQWVGYDDHDSLTRKARYVKAQGYGGMLVWTIDLDDFGNQCCMGTQPLLRSIAKELLSIPYDPNRMDCTKPVISTTPAPAVSSSTQAPADPSKPKPTGRPKPSTTTTSHHHHPTESTTATSFAPPGEITTVAPPNNNPTDATTPTTTSGALILLCHQLMGTKPPHHPTDPSTNVEPGCDNSWVYKPDPMDCSGYYQCSAGRVTHHRCSYGLHWNMNSNTCDWPSNAKCQDSQDFMATSTDNVWVTQHTTTTTRPTTTTYPPWTSRPTQWTQAPTTQTTSWTTRPTTTPRPAAWPPAQAPQGDCISGHYYPGPTCDQYYICSDGQKKVQACGAGLHWNKEKFLCDWPKNAKCQQYLGALTKPIRDGPCVEGQYSGDPTDCEVYYICDHGRKIKFRCQTGLQWNQNQKVCDWPYNVGCTPTTGGDNSGGGSYQTTTDRPQFTTTTTTQSTWTQSTTTQPTWTQQTQGTTPFTTTTRRPTTTRPGGAGPDSTGGSGDYMVVCYFTNWAWYRPDAGKYTPDNIDPSLCTHIVYGFAVLDYSTLLMKPHDTWADFDNKFYEKVTNFKSRGAKVTLAIGGWNDSEGDKYSRLVANPSARQKFISNAIDFIKKYNFDGLDLDWEYPKCWQVDCSKGPAADKPNFAAFVREIKTAFQPYGLLLSAAVSPSKMVIDQGYDVPTMSQYLDWIAVMTYDYHGQWDKKTGHVAPLYFHEEDDVYYYNTNFTMNYWIQQGASPKKLVLGMPTYGQSFTLTNPSNNGLNAPSSGGGTAGEYTRASGFLAYYEICTRVQRDGWKVVQDPDGAIGPYAYKGNQWVSYDDVAMIRKKTELIKSMGLAGGMIWALDLDDFRNTCGQGNYPLLTAINNGLGRKRSGAVGSDTVSPGMRPSKKPAPAPNKSTTMPALVAYPSVVSVVVHQQELQPIKNQQDPCSKEPYKPNSDDCRKYYRCIFGKYVEQSCPSGTFWNRDRCDWTCGNSDQQAHQPQPSPGQYTPTTTTTKRPTTTSSWTASPSSSTQWTWSSTTTVAPPSSSTSWEWKPSISTTTTIHPVVVPDSEYKVVCYFTNWAWYRQGIGKYKPEDIDYNLCTHIAYGFAVLDTTTLLMKPHDSWADIDNQFYTQVTDLRSKGKKVVVAIGGWNDSAGDKYSRLVNNPAARAKFVKNVIEFIEKWKFDGLDLDWEYPKCWQTDCKKGPEADKAAFAALCKELSEAFKPKGLLLSSAVSPSKMIIDEGYDVPAVSKYLDWIAVMTYDYHGQWDKKTGHVAPMFHHEESDNFYFNSNYTINYWISQGADRKKIIMGMPMYGQSFSLADVNEHGLNAKSYGGGTAGDFTRAQGFLAYYEICDYVKNRNWKVVQDKSGAIGPYAHKGDQWVSYDDISMIRKKSQYIKDMKLGGGMIWALDLDDFRGVCGCEKHPLLKTINRVLRNYPEPDPQCSI